ncbi:MAG: monovalent cation:proton antiporter-2 (CPA2) family protein [Lautropia sp.]|nr:monovalent cation:proton antiporter-2 (CPA2) family protein [Lautropia sp.]
MAAAEGANQFVNVVTLLGAAIVAVPLFKRLGLGSVLGYLAGGLAIGPFGLKLFNDPHAIIHVAELGVVMFLFVIGLEMKPAHLWSLRRQIFGLGSLQVLSCTALITVAAILAFDVPWQVSFVCSAGFVLTSTAIVMQVLGERGDLTAPRGQRMVSVLLLEDLLIVPLLAIVSFLAPATPDAGAADATPLWQQIGLAAGSLTVLVVAGRWLLNPLFRLLAKVKVREIMTAVALFVVLGAAVLMEAGGLSAAMGAFVAGVLLSESSFRHQLEADIEPFRGLLLGLFFLGVGMSLDLSVIAGNWGLILAGVVLCMLIKGICIYGVARLTRSSHADALDRAVLMAQGGEFAFVLYSAAAGKGVIDARTDANMTAIVVLSMVITPMMIVLYNRFMAPRLAPGGTSREQDEIHERKPVIVVGMGRFGQIVTDLLTMTGHQPTIIDLDPVTVDGWTAFGLKTYYGDASRPEILHAAGIEQAALLVLAIDDREKALQIAEFALHANPGLKIVARAYDRMHVFDLYRVGATHAVRETFDAAVRAGRDSLVMLGMDETLARQVGDIYFHEDRHTVRRMAEVYDPSLGRFKNKKLADIALAEDHRIEQLIRAAMDTHAAEQAGHAGEAAGRSAPV